MTHATPALLLTELTAAFQVAHDPLGWRINIGDDYYMRPDSRGRINGWCHAEGCNPEAARRDVELLAALVAATFAMYERHVFQGPHSSRRKLALEAIVDAANEIKHAGEEHKWIGRMN